MPGAMMLRRRRLVILLAMLALLLVACSQTTVEEPPAPVYLEETIPPCTPVDGVPADPCAQTDVPNPPCIGLNCPSPTLEGQHPYTIRWYLGGDRAGGLVAAHIVARVTYLPNTVRCEQYEKTRWPRWAGFDDFPATRTGCYADVRVNEYYLGSGPPVLTVESYRRRNGPSPEVAEQRFADIGRREEILFLGPSINAAVEVLGVHESWDVQRIGDRVVAIHPWRAYWVGETGETFRDRLEVPLADFAAAVTAAHQVRLADYGGKVDIDRYDTVTPMLQTDANMLHQFYVATGEMEHPDGPPAMPPPPCGKAVPDSTNNPGLVQDCVALQTAKDTLRGTGALNWSVDVPMSEWDGVRIEEGRVVALDLGGRGLTGCVPPSLREMAVDGLDELGLADCAG